MRPQHVLNAQLVSFALIPPNLLKHAMFTSILSLAQLLARLVHQARSVLKVSSLNVPQEKDA